MDTTYATWKNAQTPENMAALVEAAKPTLRSAATSFAQGQQDQVMAQAKILAVKAFKSFDPKKGVKLNTHLMTQLQPLYRVAHQRRSAVRIPEQASRELHNMVETEQTMRDELGRHPSDDEVSDRIGLSVSRIRGLRKYHSKELYEGSLFDEQGAPVMIGVSQPKEEDLWIDYVFHDLGNIDKQIFEWKTGANGKTILPTQVIAKRLNMTPSAVSQRAARIQTKLAEMPKL